MKENKSGDSISYAIKVLSNNIFNEFISHVEYFPGDMNFGDLYLAHVNNFISYRFHDFDRSKIYIEYVMNSNGGKLVNTDKYYKSIGKYLGPKIPVLLVGTDPLTKEMQILQ